MFVTSVRYRAYFIFTKDRKVHVLLCKSSKLISDKKRARFEPVSIVLDRSDYFSWYGAESKIYHGIIPNVTSSSAIQADEYPVSSMK